MRRPRPRGWTTSGGAQLLCRDGSECDDDEQQNELLHVADDSPSLTSPLEVSEHLVGSPAFKAGGRSDPATAGSIPVHLRHFRFWRSWVGLYDSYDRQNGGRAQLDG